jgi:uncharacterized membrane protein
MKKQSQFDAGRISAISDGVFAIAMTLLVLDLKLPDLETGMSRQEFAAALLRQAPRFVSWFLSFAILARLWIIQHALLAEGDTRSRGFVGWTFLFLGAISFIPFPTSLLSEHHEQALSVIIFSVTLGVAAIALLGMERLERRQRQLTDAEKAAGSRSSLIVTGSFLVTAVLASGVATLRPVLGVWIWAAFPIVATVLARRGGSSSRAAD